MRLSRQSCNGIKPNNTHIYIIGGSYVLPPIIVSILPCLLLLCQFCPSRNAKHCMCQRKALQPPTQSFASAHAKLCIRLRKALLEKAPSFRIIYFMTVNAKHCDYPCKRILVNALLFRNPLNFRNKSKHGFLDNN